MYGVNDILIFYLKYSVKKFRNRLIYLGRSKCRAKTNTARFTSVLNISIVCLKKTIYILIRQYFGVQSDFYATALDKMKTHGEDNCKFSSARKS